METTSTTDRPEIDPRSATPCRTVAFSSDHRWLVEANYLGFVTCRDAATGAIRSRFLAQTALVETIRFDESTGNLMLVGAGFEGYRDDGVAKLLDFPTGRRVRELDGHRDDATEIISLPGTRHRIVTVGLDRRVIVHDLDSPEDTWVWDGYADYLNTCAARPCHEGHFAIAGDSPFTFVLDANNRAVVVQLDTPGDSNGLMWSDDGRFLLVGDDHAEVKYFDSAQDWRYVGSMNVGGAAKRMVLDPRERGRVLVACYDGRIWSVPQQPEKNGSSRIVVERRRGLWGINVAATRDRIAIPSFYDRAYLLARNESGEGDTAVGPTPAATYGANWIAIGPGGNEIGVTHDDGVIRVRRASDGRLLRTLGPDSQSLYMGASFHPTLPLLATIDFYGEVWIYNLETGRPIWHKDMGFGPGICVDFSPCERYLAVGGYRRDGRVLTLDVSGTPIRETVLQAPNHGVVKSIAFALDGTLLVGAGDGCLVVHRRQGEEWKADGCHRVEPAMELSNGVAAAPDSQRAYIVSRDQSLRAFDLAGGTCLGIGWAHTRSVKSVHMSECGRYLVTGGYDRMVLVWDPETLQVRLPPLRGANSGVSCVRVCRGVIYACSFDGVVSAWHAENGELLWTKTNQDASRNM